ncbi:MAG: RluA family pseudouridine synthase [Muribaculaceae bacterium]|nr:RluA family pseudouridine synthase [Muribaculaceae bacterium]
MEVLYEDNHLMVVNKAPGEIVQGDKTGDRPLSEILKDWLKEKYAKPGNVFLGVVHRLDRPVGGVVVFAKTSKALTRLNEMFRTGKVEKTYWVLSRHRPPKEEDRLVSHIRTVERTNKSYALSAPQADTKEAVLNYRYLASSDRYHLIEVHLETGRKHQIRVQLSSIGCPVKGDLKYGDKRSNPDGSISLLARRIRFVHPVSGKEIDVTAPLPEGDTLWQYFADIPVNNEQKS